LEIGVENEIDTRRVGLAADRVNVKSRLLKAVAPVANFLKMSPWSSALVMIDNERPARCFEEC
jgi:hypothetical protein